MVQILSIWVVVLEPPFFALVVKITNIRIIIFFREEKLPTRRAFGFSLVKALVAPHIRRRCAANGTQTFVKDAAKFYLGNF